MRQLYLIGNGFDLAHGLRTSYRDFITWYLNKIWELIMQEQHSEITYNDGLIYMHRDRSATGVKLNLEVKEPADFQKCIKEYSKNASGLVLEKSFLLESIIDKNGWVDIEKEYYHIMVQIAKNIVPRTRISNSKFPFTIQILNNGLERIKKDLEVYLNYEVIPKIKSAPSLSKLEDIFNREYSDNNDNDRLFLNFNYTDVVMTKYWMNPGVVNTVINIHGEIGDINNPIIFGYGDEMIDSFKLLEDEDENQYLTNMKSFGYFETCNYKKAFEFMDQKSSFKVHVIGHSLGLSDRLLLNVIFEHENCESIEIHFRQIDNDIDNFKELTMNMSRHFNNKSAMRSKVISHDESRPMN
jgi:hypothetical protein